VPDDAVFCQKCGARLFYADTANKTDASATDGESQSPDISKTIPQPSEDSIPTTKSTVGSDNVRADFSTFIDSHVQKTTSFQSAEELLQSHVPVSFAWLCLGIPSIAMGALAIRGRDFLMILPAALLGLVFGYFPFIFVRWIERMKYAARFCGKFDKNINADELMKFLNKYLGYLRPYWHEWGYIQYKKQSIGNSALKGLLLGDVSTAIKLSIVSANLNADMDRSTGVLCSPFGIKQKELSIISIKPSAADRDSGRMLYSFDSELQAVGDNPFLSRGPGTDIGLSTYICLIKTAPILQAAVEYYIKYMPSTENNDAGVRTVMEPERITDDSERREISTEESKRKLSPLKILVCSILAVATVCTVIIFATSNPRNKTESVETESADSLNDSQQAAGSPDNETQSTVVPEHTEAKHIILSADSCLKLVQDWIDNGHPVLPGATLELREVFEDCYTYNVIKDDKGYCKIAISKYGDELYGFNENDEPIPIDEWYNNIWLPNPEHTETEPIILSADSCLKILQEWIDDGHPILPGSTLEFREEYENQYIYSVMKDDESHCKIAISRYGDELFGINGSNEPMPIEDWYNNYWLPNYDYYTGNSPVMKTGGNDVITSYEAAVNAFRRWETLHPLGYPYTVEPDYYSMEGTINLYLWIDGEQYDGLILVNRSDGLMSMYAQWLSDRPISLDEWYNNVWMSVGDVSPEDLGY